MAGENAAVHRALDGAQVHLSGPLDLALPPTSVADVVTGGRVVEFTAGGLGLEDDLAEALGHGTFDEEFGYRGGVLRLSTVRTREPRNQLVEQPTLVVWRGERYVLVTRLYHVSASDILAALRPLGLDEHEDGLTLAPGPGSRFASPAALVKEVPQVGLLEISAGAGPPVARSAGVRLPSGQLFQDTLSDGRPYFLLACDGISTTVLPLAGCDPARLPERLARLQIARLQADPLQADRHQIARHQAGRGGGVPARKPVARSA